jgi:hypothetical protein
MAMFIASGIGSIVANEIGKMALDNMPLVKQVAQNTLVNVVKKTVDFTLDNNPNFASYLGLFDFHGFNRNKSHSTLEKRARHRKIDKRH